jgi:hypothetical protein
VVFERNSDTYFKGHNKNRRYTHYEKIIGYYIRFDSRPRGVVRELRQNGGGYA